MWRTRPHREEQEANLLRALHSRYLNQHHGLRVNEVHFAVLLVFCVLLLCVSFRCCRSFSSASFTSLWRCLRFAHRCDGLRLYGVAWCGLVSLFAFCVLFGRYLCSCVLRCLFYSCFHFWDKRRPLQAGVTARKLRKRAKSRRPVLHLQAEPLSRTLRRN